MLGDCYAAAVVEQLSKKELMALDAAVIYQVIYCSSEYKTKKLITCCPQELPIPTPNGHISIDGQTDLDIKVSIPDSVIVDLNNAVNANGSTIKRI